MNSILSKEPVKRAEKSIKEFDPSLKVIVLEQTARTANDAATALGCEVGAIVKSLLFKAGENFVLCLVSGDKRCSLNKLKKLLQMHKMPTIALGDFNVNTEEDSELFIYKDQEDLWDVAHTIGCADCKGTYYYLSLIHI